MSLSEVVHNSTVSIGSSNFVCNVVVIVPKITVRNVVITVSSIV